LRKPDKKTLPKIGNGRKKNFHLTVDFCDKQACHLTTKRADNKTGRKDLTEMHVLLSLCLRWFLDLGLALQHESWTSSVNNWGGKTQVVGVGGRFPLLTLHS
jgi:hypothetical protein